MHSLLIKFRVGIAPLCIETGRYECVGAGKKGLAVEDRLCMCCGNGTEDELHFLLRCPKYSWARAKLLEVYDKNMVHPYLRSTACSEQMLFVTMMEFNNSEFMNALANFVLYAFKRREALLAQQGNAAN